MQRASPTTSDPHGSPLLPRRWHGPLGWFGHLSLFVLGWRIEGQLPNLGKAILIAAPHERTSDFLVGIAAVFRLRLSICYLGKASLFRGVLGIVMRWLGGIPVDREKSHDVVATVAAQMRKSEKMLLALSPEGTRSPVERWRSGFYHLALQAGVPIVPVALDYGEKAIRIGAPFEPSQRIEDVKVHLEAFYGDLTGPIRLG